MRTQTRNRQSPSSAGNASDQVMIGFNFTFDCQLFLFETEASYQVDGPHRERSYEQSRLIFLL